MDLSIVESFVRPDPVYTTTRADDGSASTNFSDMLQERISAPTAAENRTETDRSGRAKPADAPAEKPARSTSEPAETRAAAADKSAQEAAAKDVAAKNAVAKDATDADIEETEAAADAKTADAVADEASAEAADTDAPVPVPVVLLPMLPLPATLVAPVAAAVVEMIAEAPVVPAPAANTAPVDAAAALAPTMAPQAATTSKSAETDTPFLSLVPEAAPATQSGTPVSAPAPVQTALPELPVTAKSDENAQTAQAAPTPATAATASIALAAEPVITPVVQQANKPAIAPVGENAASAIVAEVESDASGDVITVSVDDAPVAAKADQPRLMPLSGTSVRAGEAASSVTSASAYAAQIAAQDSSAQSTDAAPVNTGTQELKGQPTQDKPTAHAPAADMPADSDNIVAQTNNTTAPLFSPETANTRAAQAVSDTSAAHAARNTSAHPMVEQVTVRMARAVADNVDRIRIQLNPVELGHIDVRMEIGPDGRFNAVFAADRPQTMEMLQRDARELTRSLQDAGLRTDMGSLSFNLRGDGRTGEQNAWRSALNEGSSVAQGNVASDTPVLPPVYSGSSLAAGRVDIRV